jgi:peptidoglycan hydrolase-like protein with peptidoglycan-binding domain
MVSEMHRSIAALLIGLSLFVTACGSRPADRAVSGAGIGAIAGTIVGAVTGLSLLQGALIGAAAGGVTGALTSEDVINLGDPIWASNTQEANGSAVSQIQAGLTELGYNPGSIDGIKGPQTESAIRAYQRDHKLLVDGRPTFELAQHIDEQMKAASG